MDPPVEGGGFMRLGRSGVTGLIGCRCWMRRWGGEDGGDGVLGMGSGSRREKLGGSSSLRQVTEKRVDCGELARWFTD